MKYVYLLLSLAFLFAACSKDDFDPSKPKDGQEVELFLDHYTLTEDARIFQNADRKQPLHTFIRNFNERELGYTYVVKAKVVVTPPTAADMPSYTFDYIQTLAKEKYQGKDTFALPLFAWLYSGGNVFVLKKEAGKYYYLNNPLTPFDAAVQADLDKAIEKGPAMVNAGPLPTFKVYVQHDPANYTTGYIVYRVQLQ